MSCCSRSHDNRAPSHAFRARRLSADYIVPHTGVFDCVPGAEHPFGMAGSLSFGHATYFGVAAYTGAFLYRFYSVDL